MLELTVAFYKGEGLRRDKIIRWWTNSPYSHVELIMPNGMIAGINPPINPYISKRNPENLNDDDWELVKIPVTEGQLSRVRAFIESTKGQGYDWIGMIASHLTPFKVKFPNKWYCSEWVLYALSVAKVFSWKELKVYNFSRMPPGRLYDIIMRKKYNGKN